MVKGEGEAGPREIVEAAVLGMDRALWLLAASWARSPEDREDLRQAMKLKVLEAAPSFRGRSDPKTWVYRVAYRAGHDWHRRHRREAASRIEVMDLEALPDPRGEESIDPEFLRGALDRLPKRQRELLVLRELEGLSYKELGEVLGISLGSVESGLHDGRKNLARLMRAGGWR